MRSRFLDNLVLRSDAMLATLPEASRACALPSAERDVGLNVPRLSPRRLSLVAAL